MFQIDKNVVQPAHSNRSVQSEWAQTIKEMEIGDSFIMPHGAGDMEPLNAAISLDMWGEVDADLTGVRRFWRTE